MKIHDEKEEISLKIIIGNNHDFFNNHTDHQKPQDD